MDMNDVYLVVVRLRDWEFMAEASHVNAKKAVRGLAADLRDFYDDGQRSSAAHLMQQGAAAVGVAAIEDARPTGECMELELAERRLEQPAGHRRRGAGRFVGHADGGSGGADRPGRRLVSEQWRRFETEQPAGGHGCWQAQSG